MAFGFLNALMLVGLASVSLPIMAHLISKRRFDVVLWGAMRFLELGQRTRRRIRLQDILLLLLRMALLACLAIALSRPWGSGRWLGALGSDIQHDFVFVLDGSTSMAWQGTPRTPHQQAVQWIFEALEDLSPGDTAALIDARAQPRRLITPPTTDRKAIRDQLTQLAKPAGTSNLPEAIEDALKILTTSQNPVRRVVVLSDDQSLAWRVDDDFTWSRVKEMRTQTQISPAIDIVTFSDDASQRQNFSVGRLELSRNVTVPEFPVKIRATISQSGGKEVARRTVSLKIDGQLLPDKTQEVDLLPDGSVTVEFEHTFAGEGNFLASVQLEPDQLPDDDHADAVIAIAAGIPVLLVDGDANIDQTRSETFYLKSVFAASGSRSPWIRSTVIRPAELNDEQLLDQQVVFLCNVEKLSQRQWELLRKFVNDGGGLVVAPGDRVDAGAWNTIEDEKLPAFLPAQFGTIQEEPSDSDAPRVSVDSQSLEVPWLQRFRKENGVDFTQTRFQKWWHLDPHHISEKTPEPKSEETPPAASPASSPVPSTNEEPSHEEPSHSLVLARLSQGDPLLVSRSYGAGRIMQFATPLDADWSTLPAKNDFVPFVYELVFALTSSGYQRNVDVGSPLFLPLTSNEIARDFVVDGPGVENLPVEAIQRGRKAFAVFRQTSIPGVYRFHRRNDRAGTSQPFVVDDDHLESDLTPLTESAWETLTSMDEVHRVKTLGDITAMTAREAPRTELWWVLLLLVLAMLVAEAALTRKMVQGGHAAIDDVLTA